MGSQVRQEVVPAKRHAKRQPRQPDPQYLQQFRSRSTNIPHFFLFGNYEGGNSSHNPTTSIDISINRYGIERYGGVSYGGVLRDGVRGREATGLEVWGTVWALLGGLLVFHIRNFCTFLHQMLEESPDSQPTLTSGSFASRIT